MVNVDYACRLGDADEVEDNDDDPKDGDMYDDDCKTGSFSVLCWHCVISSTGFGISKENTPFKNSYDVKKSAP